MANSRIARFVTEVAPPQFVSVMRRHRASKMLETINEEDREIFQSGSLTSASKTSSTLPSSYSALSSDAAKPNYFLKDVKRTFLVFGTLNEEDREISISDSLSSTTKCPSALPFSSSALSSDAARPNHFLKDVKRTCLVFDN